MADKNLIDCLNSGGVAAVRTDTLYGLVARADCESAVERIFQIKKRASDKSCIILIDEVESVASWVDMKPWREYSQQLWPGPVSIIATTRPEAPQWLTRGGESLALRMPDDSHLTSLLRATGPLVAPSANPESFPPALSIQEARAYFGDQVDYYADGGTVTNTQPSRLVRMDPGGSLEWLR